MSGIFLWMEYLNSCISTVVMDADTPMGTLIVVEEGMIPEKAEERVQWVVLYYYLLVYVDLHLSQSRKVTTGRLWTDEAWELGSFTFILAL